MTDRNKFEEMLERLVNEDKEGAEALFHEIVVEKSRDIYESLLEDEEVEETTDEEVDEATDEEVDESDEDLDEATDEEVDESDEDLDEATDEEVEEGMFDEGGDPADELGMDIEMPGADDGEMDMDMDMGDEDDADDMGMDGEGGDVEDRIEDLEDELEALKQEFADMMGADDDEAGDDMDMGGDEMPIDMDAEEPEEEAMAFEADEEVEEATDEVEESKLPKSNSELMREYADKVAPAKMGDNGANAKSPTAKPNNMGGTSANIVAGGDGGTGGTQGGLAAPTAKPMNTKNVNVPGAKGATKMSNQPGHGAEKKGAAPNQDAGAGSPLNGAPKRAK